MGIRNDNTSTRILATPAARARRRVLRAARDLAREALSERHNEVFFSVCARAVEAMLLAADVSPDEIGAVWKDARKEQKEDDNV